MKDQLILIGLQRERGVRRAEFEDMRTVRDLAEILRPVGNRRSAGTLEAQPVLICASAATGKSWSMVQLQYILAAHQEDGRAGSSRAAPTTLRMVPLLVEVQRLAPLLESGGSSSSGAVRDCRRHSNGRRTMIS